MNFTALEQIERDELELRYARCRKLLHQSAPDVEGIMIFSRVNLYYFTGHMGNGLLWLPLEGEPVLLVRRGMERARLESSLKNIFSFRSFSELPGLIQEAGGRLPKKIGADTAGLPWNLARLLTSRLSEYEFVPVDGLPLRCRSVKTEWELNKMRLTGERHRKSLCEMLPTKIHPGMTEREISHAAWEVFFSQGHCGMMRMNGFGEEIFLGHVAAGDSADYPSVFDGPVGLRGEHPAIPFMGYAGKVWTADEPLTCDIGFCLEGYATDKTQVYWPGNSLPAEVASAHSFCMDIQAMLAEQLKPGAIPSELYRAAMAEAEKHNFTEGFMAAGHNKVRFLGHGIGLVIDEYPALAEKFEEPLELGMVLALEPKHSVSGYGMVGVENTFEVTESGGKCLTGKDFNIISVTKT